MSRNVRYGQVGLFLLLSLAVINAYAKQLPGPLVDTDWLEQNLDSVKLLDVRDDLDSFTRKAVLVRKRFTGDLRLQRIGAHIPAATLVDYQNIRTSREIDGRNVRRMLPDKAEFESLMQSWGVNRDDAIVIVSPGTGIGDVTMATRLYWQIRYYGHDDVAILDGGMAAWLLEQKPASIENPEPAAGDWIAGKERRVLLADSNDVAEAVADKQTQLVDTRALGFYLGALKKSYVRSKGHIPGAKVFPNDLLTSGSVPAYFADIEDIATLANELGVKPDAAIITYCNSGQLASASWFAFSELMGNSGARLYDGSMHEWALEKRPVVKMKME